MYQTSNDNHTMLKKIILLHVIILLLSIANGQEVNKERYRLYFLGGQSNMEGHGLNADLPDALVAANDHVWIFHGNPTGDDNQNGGLGKWDMLKPGNGAGFMSDGVSNKLSHKFGPEVSFGKKLAAQYPG